MAAIATFLVCGCSDKYGDPHADGCAMGVAEQIAYEAADVALNAGAHRLTTVLVALHEAGLLGDLPADPGEVLEGLLDYLWESNVLGPADAPQATDDQASAPTVAKSDIGIPSACLVAEVPA